MTVNDVSPCTRIFEKKFEDFANIPADDCTLTVRKQFYLTVSPRRRSLAVPADYSKGAKVTQKRREKLAAFIEAAKAAPRQKPL